VLEKNRLLWGDCSGLVVLCKGLLCVERYFLLCAEPRTLLSSSLLYLKVPQVGQQ